MTKIALKIRTILRREMRKTNRNKIVQNGRKYVIISPDIDTAPGRSGVRML